MLEDLMVFMLCWDTQGESVCILIYKLFIILVLRYMLAVYFLLFVLKIVAENKTPKVNGFDYNLHFH